MGVAEFERDLEALSKKLKALSAGELDKIIDWTLNSLAHSTLKKIRAAPWPIDTKESYNLWQFYKAAPERYIIANPAVNPYDGVEYVQYVYAKGDKSRSPIADGIVDKAIADTLPEVQENFLNRLQRYLNK